MPIMYMKEKSEVTLRQDVHIYIFPCVASYYSAGAELDTGERWVSQQKRFLPYACIIRHFCMQYLLLRYVNPLGSAVLMFASETWDQCTPDVQPGRWLGGRPASSPPFLEKKCSFSAWWCLPFAAVNQFEEKTTSLTDKRETVNGTCSSCGRNSESRWEAKSAPEVRISGKLSLVSLVLQVLKPWRHCWKC